MKFYSKQFNKFMESSKDKKLFKYNKVRLWLKPSVQDIVIVTF